MEVATVNSNIEVYTELDKISGQKGLISTYPVLTSDACFGDIEGLFIDKNYIYFIPIVKGLTKKTFAYRNCRVNLFYLTCSCKVYREKVKIFKRRDLRRICKHIYYVINTYASDYYGDLTKILLETHFWFGQQNLVKVVTSTGEIFFGLKESSADVNVIVKGDCWQRFSYNLKEKKWDDCPPENRILVENVLNVIFSGSSLIDKSKL
ncbi:MAG TPA: hypothetical protein VMT35_14055 [Ignavibacteriaceae bacterium]|nr:hypothetical protein [Ignavibacteriaceae bacterium]